MSRGEVRSFMATSRAGVLEEAHALAQAALPDYPTTLVVAATPHSKGDEDSECEGSASLVSTVTLGGFYRRS